ncbi:MAG: BrnT family toxin [Methyloversatilis sp.]|nr:BrnT family toxin [Methyloversatilis sp.]
MDDRKEYGEVRYVALGMPGERLHVLCFTEITDGIRIISFRKANST